MWKRVENMSANSKQSCNTFSRLGDVTMMISSHLGASRRQELLVPIVVSKYPEQKRAKQFKKEITRVNSIVVGGGVFGRFLGLGL